MIYDKSLGKWKNQPNIKIKTFNWSENNLAQLTCDVKQLIFNDSKLAQFKSNLARLDRFDSTLRVAQDIEFLCQSSLNSNFESESYN